MTSRDGTEQYNGSRQDEFEMQADAIQPGQNVIVVE